MRDRVSFGWTYVDGNLRATFFLPGVKSVFPRALKAVPGEQIDILVNCAGIQRRAPSVEFPESFWDDVRFFRSTLMRGLGFSINCYMSGIEYESQVSFPPCPSSRPTHAP